MPMTDADVKRLNAECVELLRTGQHVSQIEVERLLDIADDYLALKAAVQKYFGTRGNRDLAGFQENVEASKVMHALAFDQQEPPHAD